MDLQIVAIGFIGLLLGAGAGYWVGTTRPSNIQDQVNSLQSQISILQSQISNKDATISTLQQQVKDKDTAILAWQKAVSDRDAAIVNWQKAVADRDTVIANLQKQLQPQTGTAVRIDSVKWEISDGIVRVFITNIGSTNANIESVKIRRNISGSDWYLGSSFLYLFVGQSDVYVWDAKYAHLQSEYFGPAPEGFLAFGTSYVVRVTCDTGFYVEGVYTSPTS